MTPAIIAAVKVCIAVMQPQITASTAGSVLQWTYPSGYEQCPDLLRARDLEGLSRAADRDAAKSEMHRIYQDGAKALEK